MEYAKIDDLIGVTMKSVVNFDNDQIVFTAEDGRSWTMYHNQDCCESVSIEDICGELSFLEGSPILTAEESTNSDSHPEDKKPDYETDSFTWTFYRLSTAKGLVVIRWFGTSNGWYSESVNLELQ